jgi:hypothetical protein
MNFFERSEPFAEVDADAAADVAIGLQTPATTVPFCNWAGVCRPMATVLSR